MRALVVFAPLFCFALACKTQPSDSPAPSPVAASSAAAASIPVAALADTKTVKLGDPITSPVTTLSDLAKNPIAFKGQTVATTGTVHAVCQERGCWMEIQDGTGDVNVRMHNHAFFVPKTSSGKKARVQGNVVLVKDGHECDEMDQTGAKVEFDATGVEIDQG